MNRGVVALATVVLVLVGLLVAANEHRRSTAADPAASTGTTADPAVAARAVPAATSEDVVVVDGQYLVTRAHDLVSVRSANGDNPQVPIDAGRGPVRYLLAGDPAAHLVWTVTGTVTGTLARAFDARTLEPRFPAVPLPAAATDAVVLDGALYVASASGVERVVPGRPPALVDRRPASHLAADPMRHRVLVLSGDRLGVVGTATAVGQPVIARAVTVVDGSVWVAGPSELYRVDPVRLVAHYVLDFGGPVQLAATGRRSLLVRQRGMLSCVDVRRREVAQSWSQVRGPIGVDADGRIWALPADGLPSVMTFGGCPG